MANSNLRVFTEIENTIKSIRVESISEERKTTLNTLVEYVQNQVNYNEEIRLNFICTHNSRRSHFSQIWAQTLAYYFGLKQVVCYSGGTEATALFPLVVETLQSSGFKIQTISEVKNPVYSIKYASNEHPIIGFSKTIDSDFNPKSDFAAIMTCNSANEACPIVPSASVRIPIMFEDPKVFDNTPQQANKYAERSLQIATELFYVFSQIKF